MELIQAERFRVGLFLPEILFVQKGASAAEKKCREPLSGWFLKFSYDSSECHILSGQLSQLLGGGFSRSHENGSYLIRESRSLRVRAAWLAVCTTVMG